MKDWNKKLADIKLNDLKEHTKDYGWVSWTLALLIVIPLMALAGVAGVFICYYSICLGASIGDIKATLYVCIGLLVLVGLIFFTLVWVEQKTYKDNKKAYAKEVQKRRNGAMGVNRAYGQPQQPRV